RWFWRFERLYFLLQFLYPPLELFYDLDGICLFGSSDKRGELNGTNQDPYKRPIFFHQFPFPLLTSQCKHSAHPSATLSSPGVLVAHAMLSQKGFMILKLLP